MNMKGPAGENGRRNLVWRSAKAFNVWAAEKRKTEEKKTNGVGKAYMAIMSIYLQLKKPPLKI